MNSLKYVLVGTGCPAFHLVLTSKQFMSQPNGLALWAELCRAVRPVAAGFLRGSAVSQGLPEVGRVLRGR